MAVSVTCGSICGCVGSEAAGAGALLKGLYKVEFETNGSEGCSVMYVHDGVMLGGNSAFAHLGLYRDAGDHVVAEITTQRHNHDPNYKAMLVNDVATIDVTGRPDGDRFRFAGSVRGMPGVVFQSVMTPLDEDESVSRAGAIGEGGIVNGLYSIHLEMLDGIGGGNTGVMLLHDGRILGGDAFFYYVGSYSSANGRWKGLILNQEHTPARGEDLIFGGYEVGIGFSGTWSGDEAHIEATALAGKRSVRFTAALKLIRRA